MGLANDRGQLLQCCAINDYIRVQRKLKGQLKKDIQISRTWFRSLPGHNKYIHQTLCFKITQESNQEVRCG